MGQSFIGSRGSNVIASHSMLALAFAALILVQFLKRFFTPDYLAYDSTPDQIPIACIMIQLLLSPRAPIPYTVLRHK